ncbi:hypothetical protein OQA88_370 [Cercophora sp. LCS_1]
MHEIITAQLGQQANYLATHFWNTQESYFTYSEDQPESPINHDIHWRPGIGVDGVETYTPRTVIYDLKGGFGSMRKINALYDDTPVAAASSQPMPKGALWNGPTTIHTQPPIPQSAYAASLDAGTSPPPLTSSTVRFWSDYNRVYYHPRSIVQLSEYEAHSSLMPFERFATGEELFADLDREHDLLDRDLRPFVEEADQMQGLQVFAGFDDAWGGFAGRYLERIRDEYGKVGVWVWGVEGGHGQEVVNREKRVLRLANKARAMVEAYKQASIVVPLGLPRTLPGNLVLDQSSPWHVTGLWAAAVESVMLPARLKERTNTDTLGGMAETLNSMGKQSIAGLQLSFAPPAEEEQGSSGKAPPGRKLTEEELAEGIELDVRFSPSYAADAAHGLRNGFSSKKPKVFSQLISLRGYPEEKDQENEMEGDQDQRNSRRQRNAYEPVTRSYNTQLRFPLLDSFPQIFQHQGSGEPLTGSVNITTSLSTDSSVSDRLKLLRTTVVRSIGLEDREMIGNDLAEMADEYHEGWSSGSDEGDDD